MVPDVQPHARLASLHTVPRLPKHRGPPWPCGFDLTPTIPTSTSLPSNCSLYPNFRHQVSSGGCAGERRRSYSGFRYQTSQKSTIRHAAGRQGGRIDFISLEQIFAMDTLRRMAKGGPITMWHRMKTVPQWWLFHARGFANTGFTPHRFLSDHALRRCYNRACTIRGVPIHGMS